MKTKNLILLAICLGCGLIAAIGALQVMGNENPIAEEETMSVLLANDFLDIRTELNEENVRVEKWPAKLIPRDVVTDPEFIKGKFNKVRLSKGLPIMIDQIADQSYFEQDMIPPGHKVVAVKVQEDDTISGLLKPGQQVDIIGVVEAPMDSSNRRYKIAKTFLKGIRVYSIDGARDGSSETQQPGRRGDAVVGVLVTEKQSEQIVLVQRVGQLKLVLRGAHTDDEPEENPDFNTIFDGIVADTDGEKKQKKVAAAPVKEEPGFEMRIFNGLEMSSHRFSREGTPLKPSGVQSQNYISAPAGGSPGLGGRGSAPSGSEFDMDFESSGAPGDFDDNAGVVEDLEEDQYIGE